MPAIRTSGPITLPLLGALKQNSAAAKTIQYPPKGSVARASFKTRDGKSVTAHRWDVYDYAMTIPEGKVVTYKDVTTALQSGSARSVGSALRNNPFAPYVPCHRVIASTLFVGGYMGEWDMANKAITGPRQNQKLDLLKAEGVLFDEKGILINKSDLWDGKVATDV